MLKIGLLGAARIAPPAIVAPARETGLATVIAVAARDPSRAASFAKAHDIPHTADSYEALIARGDIDLVYNALPPALHAPWTLKALSAGKHVLLEKPSALTMGEAKHIDEAARASGRRVIEAFHYRYHPLFERVLTIVRGGALGAIERLEAGFAVTIAEAADEIRWIKSVGGGALMDLGTYPLHWVRTAMGEEPRIAAAAMDIGFGGVDRTTKAALVFPSGAVAEIECSMAPEGGQPRAYLRIKGTSGDLSVLNPLAPQLGHLLTLTTGGDTRTETLERIPTYTHQLRAVVRGLETGAPLPTEGADIIRQMAAIDAIFAAAGVTQAPSLL